MMNAPPSKHLASLFALALGTFAILGCASRNRTLSPTEMAPWTAAHVSFEALSGPIRINHQDFTGADTESIKQATPITDGSRYLQAAVILDPQFAQWIALHGIPDAITTVPGKDGQYVVFYLNPPRSYSVEKGAAVASLNDVPRSVRRITFGEMPETQPWPVTIPQASATAFGVPPVPPPPPHQVDWASHRDDAKKVRSLLTRVDGQQAARAMDMLERLKSVEQTQGIAWSVEIFSYQYHPLAFAVPDGSIFISDKLMEETTDGELAAAMAHLMAHVRYGHYRLVPVEVVKQSVAPAETTAKSQESIEAEKKKSHSAGAVALTALADTLIVAWDVGAFATLLWMKMPPGPTGTGPFLPLASTERVERALAAGPGLEARRQAELESVKAGWPLVLAARQRDIEANYLAAQYLAGIDIHPDALFDMLMRLPLYPPLTFANQIHSEKTAFGEMYDTDNNGAFDFGKMLDTGLIPPVHHITNVEQSRQ